MTNVINYNSALAVAINADAVKDTHTMRELSDKALSIQNTADVVSKSSGSVADHYMVIASRLEDKYVSETGGKFQPVQMHHESLVYKCHESQVKFYEALAKAASQLRDMVAAEIVYLQTKYDWKKDKLPNAGDQAIRAIQAAWKHGVSVTAVATFSKLKTVNGKLNKLDDEDSLVRAKKKAKQEQGDSTSESGDETTATTDTPLVTTSLPADVQLMLEQLVTDYQNWYHKDSKIATDSLKSYAAKVSKNAGSAVNAVANAVVNG